MYIILYTFMRRGKMIKREKKREKTEGNKKQENKRGNRRAGKMTQQLSTLAAFS